MALSVEQQAKYWGIAMVVAFGAIWAMGNVLLPFIAGMAIAYFLDPVADRLEAAGLSRAASTTLITFVALVVFALLFIVLVPLLVRQIVALFSAAPGYFEQLQGVLIAKFPTMMEDDSVWRQGLQSLTETIRARGGEVVKAVLASAFTVVDVIVFMVVAPVVAFYMLLDWDRMIAVIDGWLPRDHLETIRQIARDIDTVLAGFVRGQLSVCGILGAFYAIALMVAGLQFGLIVGLVAGLLTFIPYVGSIIGGVLAIGLALFQFWDSPVMIGVVAAIFVAGQMLEGNFLTPKLVGGSIGLHPVWLMFALSAFGGFFGFTGMLIAVPVAAVLGVLFRFAISQYLGGRLYQGLANRDTSQDG